MDSEEVDIGTLRSLEAIPWVPSRLRVDTRFSPKSPLRGLSSPSAPDIVEDYSEELPSTFIPSRVKTLPYVRHTSGANSDPELPALGIEKIPRVRRWILCLAIVDFDLDVGPVLSCLYPPLKFSAAHKENVAFSAFPDSSIFETGSQIHSFKLAASGTGDMLPSPDGCVYGYSYFMQRRESAAKRGYLQRSVVILSQHPFPSLFEEFASILAPLYFSHGTPMLESACQNISNWPEPTPGSKVELWLLGSVLHAHIPSTEDELQFPESSPSNENFNPPSYILSSVPSEIPSLLDIFSATLPSLWSLWELLILCEPILVFGTTPRITSLAVWWLRDFIRPIPFAGDLRPYITIHDKDFTSLINKSPPKVGLIIGVTNPFMLSVTKQWPNVLNLGWESANDSHNHVKSKDLARTTAGNGAPPGFILETHKRYTSKERSLLRLCEEALSKGGHFEYVASQKLRRHFSSRTASFLAPLNRYLHSLIPSPAEASASWNGPSKSKRRLKPFNTIQFLSSLKTHGTPLPFKSSTKQREFYEKWLKTPSFALWLAGQEVIVMGVLKDTGPSGC